MRRLVWRWRCEGQLGQPATPAPPVVWRHIPQQQERLHQPLRHQGMFPHRHLHPHVGTPPTLASGPTESTRQRIVLIIEEQPLLQELCNRTPPISRHTIDEKELRSLRPPHTPRARMPTPCIVRHWKKILEYSHGSRASSVSMQIRADSARYPCTRSR